MTEDADVGFKNGSIRIEAIPPVFYSGQIITGSVIFDLRQELNFSALYIQFLGEGNVSWTETELVSHGSNGEKIVNVINYESHEEYFNYTETLAGGNGITQLPRTHQSFPFKYQIPFNAPSSFSGNKGGVSYSITATMVYPDMSKEELKQDFKVVAPLDLNTGNPIIKDPIDLEFEEVYSCNCFCNSDPVTIRIRLPVSGYCPGQTIPVAVEVQNDSSVEITKMIFELLTREMYRSRQPPSEYIPPEKVLTTVKRGAIMAHTKRNFTCDVIVPDMIPPYLENCSIINVGYFFRITIKLSGCNDELQDEAEICLGLVPLKETLEAEYIHPMAHSLPSGPIPINNTPELIVPGNQGFTGSHTNLSRSQNNLASYPHPVMSPGLTASNSNINRSQPNISQSAAYQHYPPPYPFAGDSNRPGYTGSNTNMSSNQNIGPSSYKDTPPPYPGNNAYPTENKSYDIGFKSPYPGAVPAVNIPLYPTGNPVGVMQPPYPGNSVGGVQPPYPTNSTLPQVNNPTNVPAPYPQSGFTPSAPPADI